MDLFAAIKKGIQNSGADAILARPNHAERAQKRALDKSRANWIYALQVDETASWMSLYQQNPGVLRGLTTVLSLAAMAKQHDDGNGESPEVRVIRGALGAVDQAGANGSTVTRETAQALSTAAGMGRDILATCSDEAIAQAAFHIRAVVGLRS